MPAAALQPDSAWAEDRATQRCDPSASQGPRSELGLSTPGLRSPSHSDLGTKAINLRGTMPRLPQQDAMHHSLTPTSQLSISR